MENMMNGTTSPLRENLGHTSRMIIVDELDSIVRNKRMDNFNNFGNGTRILLRDSTCHTRNEFWIPPTTNQGP